MFLFKKTINQFEIYEILEKHSFMRCKSALVDVSLLIEKDTGFNLIQPLSNDLKYQIDKKIKLLLICKKKIKKGRATFKFINDIKSLYYEFTINLNETNYVDKKINENLITKGIPEISNQMAILSNKFENLKLNCMTNYATVSKIIIIKNDDFKKIIEDLESKFKAISINYDLVTDFKTLNIKC